MAGGRRRGRAARRPVPPAPGVRPRRRELVIGCGSALEHLCIGLAHHGLGAAVATFPDRSQPDLLACVDATGPPSVPDPDLYAALAVRRTDRHPYGPAPLPAGLAVVLDGEAAACGAALAWLEGPDQRQGLVDLVMRADREQMADPAFRHELASWMRRPHARTTDGMPTDALGQHGLAAELAPLAVRTFDVGKGQAAHDGQLTEGSPGLAVLWTDGDDGPSWLAAGQALARVVLRARAAGVSSAYMNQPCELPARRRDLANLLGLGDRDGHPQLVLRLGAGPGSRRTPRRSVADVLDS